jgi:hypothetical protein
MIYQYAGEKYISQPVLFSSLSSMDSLVEKGQDGMSLQFCNCLKSVKILRCSGVLKDPEGMCALIEEMDSAFSTG